MTPTLGKILVSAALVLGLLGLVAFGVDGCHRKQVTQAEQQANQDHGVADAHKTEAQASDALVADIKAKLDDQAKALDRLMAERNALRAKLLQAKTPSPDPVSEPAPTAGPVPDLRDAIISKDAQVISAYAERVAGQDVLITNLTISRDQWKASAEARERESVGLRIALDAQKSVSASSKWTGRIQGFVVGIGAGYLAGRTH